MCCDERIDKKHSMGKSLRRLKYMIRKTRVLLPAHSVEKVVGVASKQGSLFIEAAIVIPLFLIFVLGFHFKTFLKTHFSFFIFLKGDEKRKK